MADEERSITSLDKTKSTIILLAFAVPLFIAGLWIRGCGTSETKTEAQQEEPQETASTSSGSFLDRPPQEPDTTASPMTPFFGNSQVLEEERNRKPEMRALTQRPPTAEEIGQSFSPSNGGSVYSQSQGYSSGRSAEPKLSPREQAYQEAKTAGLSGGNHEQASPQAPQSSSPPETQNPYSPQAIEKRIRAAQGIASQRTAQASQQSNRNTQSNFQERVSEAQSSLAYQAQVQEAPGRYRIPAGTKVEAAFVDAINSNLPGTITAQITRDVYDQNNHRVLIPGGSTLIGTYDDAIAGGQNRLMVAWTRIQMRGGKTIVLPGLRSASLSGKSGVSGDVDNHYGRVFGSAVAMSAIGAGFQLTQNNNSGGYGGGQTPQQVVGAEVGREFSRVAAEMLRQNMNIEPTINIPRGKRFTVVFGKDLVFDQPYQPAPAINRFRAPATNPQLTNR